MKLTSLLAASLLAAAAGAQTSQFVAPSKYQNTRGNAYNYYTFYTSYVPYHAQWLYNTADIVPVVAPIRGIALRRTCATGNTCPSATATVEVRLATGPNTAASASSTFAANLGTNATLMFPKAQISMPQSSYVSTGIPPYQVIIPFSAPFLYTKPSGKSLVVDIKVSAYNPISSTGQWWLDAAKQEYGKWAYVLSSFPNQGCVYSNNKVSAGGGTLYAQLYPGGYFYFSQSGMPANLTGVVFVGGYGPGMTWLGLQLPFSLAFLGAGTCQLGTSPTFILPCTTDNSGRWTWPRVTIPNDQALVGATLYEQGLFLDPGANIANLVTTFVMSWPIGSGLYPEGSEVYRQKDTASSPTGTIRREVPILRFTY